VANPEWHAEEQQLFGEAQPVNRAKKLVTMSAVMGDEGKMWVFMSGSFESSKFACTERFCHVAIEGHMTRLVQTARL
jgi:hypothetical protein